jgi:hypothetical protein
MMVPGKDGSFDEKVLLVVFFRGTPDAVARSFLRLSPPQNMWLPFAAEVGWVIDGKEVIYWQGRIEHWETH